VDSPPGILISDARYEGAPARIVSDTLVPVGASDAPLPGGDADAGVDAAASDATGDAPRDAGPDRVLDATPLDRAADLAVPGACELVRQNCDRGAACYRSPGGARCVAEGTSGEGAPCFDDTQCDRNHVCQESPGSAPACRRICDVAQPLSCPRGDQCRALPGFIPAGFCAP
jgi:hypothetical protein